MRFTYDENGQVIDDRFIPVPEAAETLGVNRQHVYRLIWDGKIPTVNIGARRLILPSVLRRFMEERIAEAARGGRDE